MGLGDVVCGHGPDSAVPAVPTASDRCPDAVPAIEAVVRETISIYVNSAPDMQVVGTAADGRAAVQMAETLRPDIILMDIQMPRVDGVEAVAEVLRLLPRTHVVMITTFTSREAVVPALRAGALGYVLKSDPPERLLSAVR